MEPKPRGRGKGLAAEAAELRRMGEKDHNGMGKPDLHLSNRSSARMHTGTLRFLAEDPRNTFFSSSAPPRLPTLHLPPASCTSL